MGALMVGKWDFAQPHPPIFCPKKCIMGGVNKHDYSTTSNTNTTTIINIIIITFFF
jgi:hypothetical protein